MSSQESKPELEEMPSLLAGVMLTAFSCIALLVWGILAGNGWFGGREDSALHNLFLMIIVYSPWIYWLYCVKKLHDAIWAVSGYNHDISPSKAVAFHCIPVVNIWWVFRRPSEIARFVNWRCQAKVMHGWVAGVLMLAALIVFNLLSVFGAFALYAAGFYIARHMRRAFMAPEVPDHARESMMPGVLGLS